MRLVLFDIDGTLILTGGAGMRAFYRALHRVFDLAVDSEVIRPDGKTDPLIAKEFLAHFGRSDCWNEQSRDALFSCYIDCLDQEMGKAIECNAVRILPGVMDLLKSLSASPDYALGLVTGNVEQGARIKLACAGLWQYFDFGGYGSDSEDRTALIRAAIERGTRRIAPVSPDAAFVIGDTPLDIIHGRAAGAAVIAVASARYGVEELRQYNPDLLVPSLAPIDPILSFLERQKPEAGIRKPE
jgi:phosphoglycolate phosphatase-like HAD superfamily hydrolase